MANPSERQKRKLALQKKHEQLDITDPFSKREQSGLGKRNMAFIRDLQISRKITKKEALKLYGDTNLKDKKLQKKLQNETRKRIVDYYSQKQPFKITKDGDFVAPKTKEEKQAEKKQIMKLKSFIKTEKQKVSDYLHSEKWRNTPKYDLIVKNHKIYPDASLFELRKGVNSKEAQKFRLTHGLEKNYSGRVKK